MSSEGSGEDLRIYAAKIEELAKTLGLDYYPVDFEMASQGLMTEISVYGLPIRMPHWSFGVRYIHQLARQSMGHSKIFEVMFPGDPCRAFLMETNTLPENTLVTAHVLGHADFSKNNQLFSRFHAMSGGNIVEHAAQHAHQIQLAIEAHGVEKVEPILDAALALESHIDVNGDLYRKPYPEFLEVKPEEIASEFQKRFGSLPGMSQPVKERSSAKVKSPIPPHPEYDLLWFIAQYAPDMEQWERDIFMMVRAEAMYFYPIFACQIMNEGWASYWHARLLREAEFLPQSVYLSAIKAHSDVVRPHAAEKETALVVNPYHLGFIMWEHIVKVHGMDKAREAMKQDDDFSFIRNWLNEDLVKEAKFFVYTEGSDKSIRVTSKDLAKIKEGILSPKFNYGAPRVSAVEMKLDGTLVLAHDYGTDGRGLDLIRARKVMEYVKKVWRRNVVMNTLNQRAEPTQLTL